MPRLDFYAEFKLYLKIRLGDGAIRLGRGPDCEVQLPSDRVSRQHALIRPAGDGAYEIENLSANGTRLNAALVEQPTRLEPGDRIYISDYVLVYQPDDAPAENLQLDPTLLE